MQKGGELNISLQTLTPSIGNIIPIIDTEIEQNNQLMQNRNALVFELNELTAKEFLYNNKTAILVTHNLSEAISMADRILVFSSRPSTIQSEFNIQLTISPDDTSPLAYRNAPEYQSYFNEIWKELNHEAKQIA